MNSTVSASRRWAARLAAAIVLAITASSTGVMGGAFPGTLIERVAAADPSLDPSPDPSASPSADPTSTPQPSAAASPTEPVPTVGPSPTPSGDSTPSADQTPLATTSIAVEPTASPDAATPSPQASLPSSPLVLEYQLSSGQQPGTAVGRPIPLYRLVLPRTALAANSPHVPTGLAGADCATCHATHTAAGRDLTRSTSETSLCLTCHDGSGSSLDVQAQLAGLPANDGTTDAYYSHPISDASAALHDGGANEFGGVLSRHSVCADCHNPHDATAARPAQSTTGWTASGAVRDASGVAVSNGPAGSAPTYTPVRSGAGLTYEYQLCLTCHSGWTVLPTRSPADPSWWALDKGIELNPASTSHHPVEAAGANQTAQMAASLAGTSPFKAWNLTTDATIRCTSCHGDPSTVNQTATASPLQPAMDAPEAPHGSPNRGLLTAPYRDRALKPVGEAYASGDFALCYLCHAERPFTDPNVDPSAPDTLFPVHGAHLTLYAGTVQAGLSIDTAGDGGGFAICAECHFRIHGTAVAYAPGDTAPAARTTGSASLVGFAPDVTGAQGLPPTWSRPGADGQGSCTLTCHGHEHSVASSVYVTAPGAGFTASLLSGPRGASGLTVSFTDATRYADPASATWSWDFGDGQRSNAVSPTHTYLATGSYTVSLTVTRTDGSGLSSTLSRTDLVTVTP